MDTYIHVHSSQMKGERMYIKLVDGRLCRTRLNEPQNMGYEKFSKQILIL